MTDTETFETIRYTADVVAVTPDGHVLLIERGWDPYEGRWALPGGHVNRGETGRQAAVRELAEETDVHAQPADLYEIGPFDRPDRDPRGRYVTVAYLVVVPAGTPIVAGDDARTARWWPLDALPQLAFDHDEILRAAMASPGLINLGLSCPQCHSTDLKPDILRYPTGGTDITSFVCLRCAAAWEPWETPAFPAPNYADAPTLADEEHELELLADDINTRATAALTSNGPSVPSVDHRWLLLRKAAWLDRAAHEREVSWYLGDVPAAQVNQGTAWADQAAHTLLTWDLEHDRDDVAGPISPDSPTWTGASGARAYVRQEYRALLDQQQETEDRAHIEPSRGPDGELYDATGKPL